MSRDCAVLGAVCARAACGTRASASSNVASMRRPVLRHRRLSDCCVMSVAARTRSPFSSVRLAAARSASAHGVGADNSPDLSRACCRPRRVDSNASEQLSAYCQHANHRTELEATRIDAAAMITMNEKSGPPNHVVARLIAITCEITIHTRDAKILMSRGTDKFVSTRRQAVSNCRQVARL